MTQSRFYPACLRENNRYADLSCRVQSEPESKDYSEIASYYRPGHADYTFDQKYGFRDYRGGGRSSGRETIGRVAAGAIAVKILNQLGITFLTYTRSIGPISISSQNFDAAQIMKIRSTCRMPTLRKTQKII